MVLVLCTVCQYLHVYLSRRRKYEKYVYYEWRHVVAQLVEALPYKLEGRGFGYRWRQSFRPHYGPGVDSASNINEYREYFLG